MVSDIRYVSRPTFETVNEERELILAMFHSAKAVFPMFDNIGAYLVIDNEIRYIASIVYTIEDLNSISVVPGYLHRNTTEPYIIKAHEVKDYVKEYYGDFGLEIIEKYGYSKASVFLPFNFDNGVQGGINMGIFTDSEHELTDELLENLRLFQKIFVVFYEQSKLTTKIKETQLKIIDSFMSSLEAYDQYTKDHSRHVTDFSMQMANVMKLSDNQKEDLYYAATLHDIGKIYINRTLLNKPSKLTKEEYEHIKEHPVHSGKIILDVLHQENIANVVRAHHERFDGNGYPDGLEGEKIPLLARIITVVDSFEAMTAERSYKRRMTVDEAVQELIDFKGIQFDPDIVDLFIDYVKNA